MAKPGVSLITAVAPAWATDFEGRPIATHYEVEGNVLVQEVERSSATTAYPVVADPWWGRQYAISATSTNKLLAESLCA